jgi:hypothetical protein
MCTVTINVDDATLRRINPGLTTRESIGQWLQNQVNLMISELAAPRQSPNAHTAEEMQAILLDRIRRAEAGEEPVVSHQEVSDSIRSKYGF